MTLPARQGILITTDVVAVQLIKVLNREYNGEIILQELVRKVKVNIYLRYFILL